MPIVDAVKACLTKYADFDGRATRTEYWWFFLAVLLGSAAASLIGDLARSSGVREALQWFTREKQWINEQHLELCRIPSPTFLEHQRAVWIATQFRGYGCDV